jgi:hypothetical protein
MLSGVRGARAKRASDDGSRPVEWIRNIRNVERILGSLVIGGGKEGRSHCERRDCSVAEAKRLCVRVAELAICPGLISRSDTSLSWSWGWRALKGRQCGQRRSFVAVCRCLEGWRRKGDPRLQLSRKGRKWRSYEGKRGQRWSEGTAETHSAPTAIPVADRCSVQLTPARQWSCEAVADMHFGCRAATTNPLAEATIQKTIKSRGRNRDIDSICVRF